MATKQPKPKFTENPFAHLQKMAAEFGIEQYNVKVYRQIKGARAAEYLDDWPGMHFSDIQHIEQLIKDAFGGSGGGTYSIQISDPTLNMDKPLIYAVPIDGDPLPRISGGPPQVPPAPPSPYQPNFPGSPYTPNPYQQSPWSNPAYGPPYAQPGSITPFYPGMQPPPPPVPHPGYMGRYWSQPYPQPYDRPGDQGPNPEVQHWREKFDEQAKQFDEFKRERSEEKRESELTLQQKTYESKMEKMDNDWKARFDEIGRKLDSKGGEEGGATAKMMELQLQNMNQNQQNFMNFMQTSMDNNRQSVQQNVDHTRAMMDQQNQNNQDRMGMYQMYFDKLETLSDPRKHLDMLSEMGKQQANWANLFAQMFQSGVFGDSSDLPPWATVLKGGLEHAGGLVNRFIDIKETETQQTAVDSRMRQQPPRGGAPFPRQPGVPQPPQQPQPGAQQQGQMPPGADAVINYGINQVVNMLKAKAPPEKVGRVLYNHCDYLRSLEILPKQIAEIFGKPQETIRGLVAHLKAPVDQAYIDAIIAAFKEVQADMEGEEPDMREQIAPAPPPGSVPPVHAPPQHINQQPGPVQGPIPPHAPVPAAPAVPPPQPQQEAQPLGSVLPVEPRGPVVITSNIPGIIDVDPEEGGLEADL